MGIKTNEQQRIARLEAICNQLRAEMDDVLTSAYQKAVENKEEERAAEIVRKIRNKLLELSDKECVFDKILPDVPIGTSFSDWLDWLQKLSSIKTNKWAIYRQALRDVPQQEGFPFNVVFPKSPNDEE